MYICICMYICVCIYGFQLTIRVLHERFLGLHVYTHVCMYVCMCVWMYVHWPSVPFMKDSLAHMYICICMYICVCIYVCMYVYVCIHVYVYMCMYISICIYMYACMNTDHRCPSWKFPWPICIYVCIFVCMDILCNHSFSCDIAIYTYTGIQTYIHTNANTHLSNLDFHDSA
jgi:hypothetical protein